MKIEEKLALCAIKKDDQSHIELVADSCKTCPNRICLRACPAHLYTLEPGAEVPRLDHAGCLECGTCLVVCPLQAVRWRYPRPSFGIHYRFG